MVSPQVVTTATFNSGVRVFYREDISGETVSSVHSAAVLWPTAKGLGM